MNKERYTKPKDVPEVESQEEVQSFRVGDYMRFFFETESGRTYILTRSEDHKTYMLMRTDAASPGGDAVSIPAEKIANSVIKVGEQFKYLDGQTSAVKGPIHPTLPFKI